MSTRLWTRRVATTGPRRAHVADVGDIMAAGYRIRLPARRVATRRQPGGASNAAINRDVMALKRMFTLAVQGGKLLARA